MSKLTESANKDIVMNTGQLDAVEATKIQIFQAADGVVRLEVTLDQDTVWLNQRQMAELFDKDVRTVNEHIHNLFNEGELLPEATIRKSRIVQQEGARQVNRVVEHYNLDVVISVGYRVKSQRGVQFRQWATQRLREYLIQGYSLNQQRLEAQQEKLGELKQAIALSARLIQKKDLSTAESQGILAILEKYSHALTVLDDYDHQRLQVLGTRTLALPKITYDEAMQQILLWRQRESLSGLFGN